MTQSIKMAHAFVVIANYAKNVLILYILPPYSPSPQVPFLPPLQIMKCYIAHYSCFHLLLNYSCTFLKRKTVGEKLKELKGESVEIEKNQIFFHFEFKFSN